MKKTFKFASLIMALVLAFCFSTAALAETAAPVATAELLAATAEPAADATAEAALDATIVPEVTAVVSTDDEITIGETEETTKNPVSAPEGVRTAIIVVIALCSAAIIAVVLMQQTKSGGLGSAFGSDTQSFTARGKAASREAKLQKITLALGIAIAVLAILLAILD